MKKEKEKTGSRKPGMGFRGLFRTILLSSLLCMFVPLVLTVVYTTVNVSGNVTGIQESSLRSLSLEKMNELDSIIRNQIQLTKSVANSPYIASIIAEQNKSGKTDGQENGKLQDYLATISEDGYGLYENFFITCGSMGVADILGGETLHDVTGEPWYEACVAEGSFLGKNISPVTGRPVFVISYAIKDPQSGQVVGG